MAGVVRRSCLASLSPSRFGCQVAAHAPRVSRDARRDGFRTSATLSEPLRAAIALETRPQVAPVLVTALPGAPPAPVAHNEYYMRELPAVCIPFTSAEGRTLFAEALAGGTMESYFTLASQFRTQDEPAYCGLTTLVMALNALNIDPRRLWKGPWRWFSEEMLDCCRPMHEIKQHGIDLHTFVCLANCHSAAAEIFRPPPPRQLLQDATVPRPERSTAASSAPLTEDDFRRTVEAASRKAEGEVLALSYSRLALGQTGAGHFSPLGGYHKGRDMVLVLDVARFKYMPHWVPVSAMWAAMQEVDKDTGLPRGYVRLRRRAATPLLLFHLSSGHSSEVASGTPPPTSVCMSRRLRSSLEAGLANAKRAICTPAASAPSTGNGGVAAPTLAAAITTFIIAFESQSNTGIQTDASSAAARCIDKLSKEHITVASSLLTELEATPFYRHVRHAVGDESEPATTRQPHETLLLTSEVTTPPPSVLADFVAMSTTTSTSTSTSTTYSGVGVGAAKSGCTTCGISCIRVHKAHVLTVSSCATLGAVQPARLDTRLTRPMAFACVLQHVVL